MKTDEKKKMLIFLLALSVLSVFSIATFSVHVLYMYIVAIATAFVVEFLFTKLRKKEPKFIYWLQTPLLFVLFLPAQAPLWLVIYGTFFAVFFGKAVFGGDDNYIFNPAMVGLLFVTVSFPQELNNEWIHALTNVSVGANSSAYNLSHGSLTSSVWDLLMANSAGTVGEVFRLLILVLGALLIILKVIDWKIPVAFLGSYFLFSLFGNLSKGNANIVDAFKPMLVGTVMLAAFFVATDEPTAAVHPMGRILYGVGLGLFTFIIRTFSEFVDGVIFVIVIMNTLAPLIDKINFGKKQDAEVEEVGVA